jgi:hypothetical protein
LEIFEKRKAEKKKNKPVPSFSFFLRKKDSRKEEKGRFILIIIIGTVKTGEGMKLELGLVPSTVALIFFFYF